MEHTKGLQLHIIEIQVVIPLPTTKLSDTTVKPYFIPSRPPAKGLLWIS